MKRADYEARFYVALKRITAYMSPEQMGRRAEKEYGLDYAEALEMAYENIQGEAREALRGYRPPRKPKTVSPALGEDRKLSTGEIQRADKSLEPT